MSFVGSPRGGNVRLFLQDEELAVPVMSPVEFCLEIGGTTSEGEVKLLGILGRSGTQEELTRTIAELAEGNAPGQDVVIKLYFGWIKHRTLEDFAKAVYQVVSAAEAANLGGRKVNLIIRVPGLRTGKYVCP